jgi:hypothetical protein
MEDNEIKKNLEEKRSILIWLAKNKINTIEKVGSVISDYYRDPEKLLKMIKS